MHPMKKKTTKRATSKKSSAKKARRAFHLNHYSGTFLFLTAALLGITSRSFLTSFAAPTLVTWTGEASDNWEDKGNWNPKIVPDNGLYDVTIPSKAHQPILHAARTVGNLTLSGKVDLNGYDLTVRGTLDAANGTVRRKCHETLTAMGVGSIIKRTEYVGENPVGQPCVIQDNLPMRDLLLLAPDKETFLLDATLEISGGFWLNAGLLNLQGNSLKAASIVNHGKVLLQGTEHVTASLDNAGTIDGRGTWILVGNRNGSADLITLGLTRLTNLVVEPADAGEIFLVKDSFFVRRDVSFKGGTVRVGDGAVFTVTGSLLLDGGTVNAAGSVAVWKSTTLKRGTYTLVGRGNQSFKDLTINGANVNGGGAAGKMTVEGNFALSAGSFVAPMRLILNGNVSLKGGTFDPRIGTVYLTGTQQKITGSGTFFNLTKLVTKKDTLTIQSGALLTVRGVLTLQGSKGNALLLRSTEPGTRWTINPLGKRLLGFLNVQDSANINTTAVSCKKSCLDAGNNTKWIFK